MKVSYVEGLASYDGPESCAHGRKGVGEALTGGRAGRVVSPEMHAPRDKARVIEFGRFARESPRRAGQGKPQTFDFLDFTHCCGKTKNGKFMLLRPTCAERLCARLHKIEFSKRMHHTIPEQGQSLRAVVARNGQYFGVPCNGARLSAFRSQFARLWHCTLCRRSQTHRLPWRRMHRLMERWLPRPSIRHQYVTPPASDRHYPRQELYAVVPHVRISAGGVG